MPEAETGHRDLSARIAEALGEEIVAGRIKVDTRLPSEAELAESFGVSRSTVREALKRLAARNLIRTRRGAAGGAFVRRLSFAEAREELATTTTLLLSMNAVDFETACEARFALERAALPLACARRGPDHLAAMAAELARQAEPGLSDEAFCASDVAFHRTMVEASGNPVLAWQLAAAVEAIEPLMNMITYTARDRARVVAVHGDLLAAVRERDASRAEAELARLAGYVAALGRGEVDRRRGAAGPRPGFSGPDRAGRPSP